MNENENQIIDEEEKDQEEIIEEGPKEEEPEEEDEEPEEEGPKEEEPEEEEKDTRSKYRIKNKAQAGQSGYGTTKKLIVFNKEGIATVSKKEYDHFLKVPGYKGV